VLPLGERWLASSRARYLIIEPSGSTRGSRANIGFRGGAEVHGVAVDPASADQPLPLPNSRLRLAVERYRVGNGLEVMLWPDGSTPLVHARIVVRAGSAHDPKGAEGVADLVGADSVAADSMIFEERGLAIGVDHLIARLTADYQNTAQVTDKARDHIKRRLTRTRARERAKYGRDFSAALWGNDHPYAREGVSVESIDKIHLDLVNGWARDHVVAKNSVLILSGNFDAELIKRHIAFHLDGVRAGNPSPPTPASEMPKGPQWIVGVEAKVSPTVEIDVAFRSSMTLASYAEALVLEGVLDSKLAQLREGKALTYGFGASFVPRVGGNSWLISGQVDARRSAEGAALVVKTLAEIRANPESYRRAFVLARRKSLESLLASGTSSGTIADRLAFMARFDLPPEFFDVVAARIAQLTLDKFQAFVARELAVEHQVFGAFGNEDAAAAAADAAKR
jgi:predicted Zn-dependent peptidase